MPANSSSVPRRILRNNGMSPMPSGSRRMTSSVTPGRMVGLIMPTTPRQLENFITDFSVVEVGAVATQRRITCHNPSSPRRARHIPRPYHEQARRDRGGADRRSRRRPRFAASDAARREAALVVAANDGGVFQKLVLAQQAQAAAPLAGTARIGDKFEAGDAAGKLGFENFDRSDVQVAQMRRRGGGAVVAHAAAIGRAHDLVLHGGLAGTALGPGDGQRAR